MQTKYNNFAFSKQHQTHPTIEDRWLSLAGKCIIYDKSGGYSGFMGNSMYQVASITGIAIKNEMDYYFPHKHYYDYFEEGGIPIRNDLANIPTIEYNEPHFHYADIQLDKNKNYNLRSNAYGFQSWRYFEHCEGLIKLMFTFKESIQQKVKSKYSHVFDLQKSGKSLCFIHVRRGDYLNQLDCHPVMSMDYYNRAIDYIKSKSPNSIFIIFSDDINWCRQNFVSNSEFYFIEGNDQGIDMCFMTFCSHGIMANSTMSLWGGYLIKNPNKIVIAPQKNIWLGAKFSHWIVDDLYMPEWVII